MYTLQDFINDSPISESLKVLSCPPDPAEVFISSISVQELPLEDFIMENEIILSTAIGCQNNESLMRQFIKAVKEAKASALILTFKDEAYQLSDSIARYAAQIGMPLFTIPWKIRFADVIHFVTKRIQDKNLEAYKLTQDKLFSAYFTSQPLPAAARILYHFLGSPVAIAGKDMELRGCYPEHHQSNDYKIIEIRLNAFLWGYLHIYEPEKCSTLLSNLELLEKYISLPLSLWFNQENIESMTVMKMKSDFVWNLANKNYTSFPEMAQQGKKLGFNLYHPYMCVALRVSPKDPDAVLDEYSSCAASLTAAIENLILAERKRLGLNIMFAERGLLFVTYVEVSSGTAESTLERIVQSMDKHFSQQYPALQLHWGASEVSREDVVRFDRLYQNAYLALQYCITSQNGTHLFTYKDSRFHQVISELSGSERLKQAAEETLSKLRNYEKNSSMDLIHTLIEFIRSNYNTSLTARQLHLNRQSLLYRLRKIEALTELSLSDRRDLLLLELFTRIYSDY